MKWWLMGRGKNSYSYFQGWGLKKESKKEGKEGEKEEGRESGRQKREGERMTEPRVEV